MTDDMDGTPGAQERTFAVAGIEYAIDLTGDNWVKFLELLDPYRSRARVARRSRRSTYPPLTKKDRAAIRVWADENGYQLAAKGRFPTEVVEKYFAESYTVSIRDEAGLALV